MKSYILASLALTSVCFADTLHEEDFEASMGTVSYTTSVPEFSDGSNDYFIRTDGSDLNANVQFTGQTGSFFGAQDIDGEVASPEQTLTFEDIDISGFNNLQFFTDFAEDDDGGNQDWDDSDFLLVEYSIDGGSFQNLFAIENDGSQFNSAPLVDTDFDGDGDGAEITSTFQTFNAAIAGTGSELDVRFTMSLNSGDEDIAFDNFLITGDAVAAIPEPTAIGFLGMLMAGSLLRRRRREDEV